METIEKRCAFIQAQAACAIAEIAAMQAENQQCLALNLPIVYGEDDFMLVQSKYVIGNNEVLEYLRDV